MLQELGREATAEEIGEKMGMSAEKVREIMKIAQDPVSLETPIGEEEDSHLGDFIADESTPSPAEAASYVMLHKALFEVLKTLTPREEQVLKLRFGLIDGKEKTQKETAELIGISQSYISRLEKKIIRKLRTKLEKALL